MVRKTLAIGSLLFLTACGSLPTKTEIQYVDRPILFCPAPPVTERPILLIDQLTDEDKKDPGKVAQIYKAAIKQLTNHVEELELIIDRYDETSKQYDDLRRIVDERFPTK